MAKLSAAQVRALQKLRKADDGYRFVAIATAAVLTRLGYAVGERKSRVHLRITDSGRAALAEAEAKQ